MPIARIRRGIISGFKAFNRSAPFHEKIGVWFLGLVVLTAIALTAYFAVASLYEDYLFDRLSSADHMSRARAACGQHSPCANPSAAIIELRAIRPSAPEYIEGHGLGDAIAEQQNHEHETARKKSLDQMLRNTQGLAHDSFICATSTEQKPIMSFDQGGFWWNDDGRCFQRQQESKNEDAQFSSYLPTTIRVDTDFDSSWLPDEERTCQTLPNEKGRCRLSFATLPSRPKITIFR